MKLTLLIALVLSTILPGMSEARTWHVEPDSTGQVINIQAGIDSAAAGDTVLVAIGCYEGEGNYNIDFRGKPIVVRSTAEEGQSCAWIGWNCALLSRLGFDCRHMDVTKLEEIYHDYQILKEAELRANTETNAGSEQNVGFHFHSGEDSAAVLEGFCVCYSIIIEDSSPKINDCVIMFENFSTVGIHCENSRAIIENNLMLGGFGNVGIYCTSSRALIENNEFRYDLGEKIYCASDSSSIVNNYIAGGTSGTLETQIYCQDSHNIIKGNEICGPDWGTVAIHCRRGSHEISDNTIRGMFECWGIVCDSCQTTIYNNSLSRGLNALVIEGGSHSIYNNNFQNYGRGYAYNYGPTISLRSIDSTSIFTNNTIYSGVDGILCVNSSPIISDNIIVNNTASDMGGVAVGIHCSHSSPLIIRNTIAYNTTSFWGEAGGIYCYESSPRIENCIIAYNGYNSGYGYGIYCADELSVPTIMNCNVYGNKDLDYAGIPDQTGINGNFSLAPIFCDPNNLEFTLHALSPCLPENNPYGPECGLIGALGLGCNYIATLLQSFDAEYNDSAVRIEWKVSEASDISDFEIYRASAPGWEFLAVNDPELDGGGTSFTYRDRDISPGTAYKYRVLVFDESAARVLFETDRIAVPAMPLALNQNYPNPFNPSTRITYHMPANDRVTLDVYDVSGRLVTRLVDDVQETGNHSVDWNGTNSNGSNVSSGTYFYRLTSGKETISKKMVLLK